MNEKYLGLIELALVFGVVLVLAIYELLTVPREQSDTTRNVSHSKLHDDSAP